MKNKLFSTITMLFVLLPITSFADKHDCALEPDSIECTYVTGLNEANLHEGRYVKSEYVYRGQSLGSATFCINNTATYTLDAKTAAQYVGNLEQIISICQDASGKNCEIMNDSNIQISQVGNTYQVTPSFIEVNLTPYLKAPYCDPTALAYKIKQNIKLPH